MIFLMLDCLILVFLCELETFSVVTCRHQAFERLYPTRCSVLRTLRSDIISDHSWLISAVIWCSVVLHQCCHPVFSPSIDSGAVYRLTYQSLKTFNNCWSWTFNECCCFADSRYIASLCRLSTHVQMLFNHVVYLQREISFTVIIYNLLPFLIS